jgi:hypothetical protein
VNYRSQTPANRGAGEVGAENVADLFRPGYVFGERVYDVDNHPGPANAQVAGTASALTEQPEAPPAWLTLPPAADPTPAALGNTGVGADGAWYSWDGSQPLTLKIPSGDDVRSLWIPVTPSQIAISPGAATGSIMYAEASGTTGENIPIPKGSSQITVTSTQGKFPAPIFLFVTSITYPPFKRAGSNVYVGVDPIVVTPGSGVNPAQIGIPLVTDGNGPPGFIPPAGEGTIYLRKDTGDLYQCKQYVAGAAGLHALQVGDNPTHLYQLGESAGTLALNTGSWANANGTYAGTIARAQPALSADQPYAVQFDGASGKMTIPPTGLGPAGYDMPNWTSGDFSFELYFRTPSSPPFATSVQLMGTQGPGGGSGNFPELSLSIRGDGQYAQGSFTVGAGFAPIPLDVTLGDPNGIVVVVSRSTGNVFYYSRGVLVNQGSTSTMYGLYSFSAPLTLGYEINGNIYGRVIMQSFAWYSHALTAQQVASHWNALGNRGAAQWVRLIQEPLIETGFGAPNYAAPVGSLYTRTDNTGPGSRLYWSNGDGTWSPIDVSANVASLNGATGVLNVVGGAGATVKTSGQTVTIGATGTLPLCNGDTPGPSFLADANGAAIGVLL